MAKGTIQSELVSNGFTQVKALRKVFPNLLNSLPDEEEVRAALLLVRMAHATFLCCLAGGKAGERVTLRWEKGGAERVEGEPDIQMSAMGEFTMAMAARFLEIGKRMLFCPVSCESSAGELEFQVHDALLLAWDGDLVIFIGDIARACDGKILPRLNVVGMVELAVQREVGSYQGERDELPAM